MNDIIIAGVFIGLIATALSDVWAVFLEKAFKVPNYGFDVVGRWIGHMARGQFFHKPIFASPPIPGEKTIGWIAHYALGAAFGFLPILLGGGTDWIAEPTWAVAIAAGFLTLAVPFFVVVPAFGMGVLCSRAPDPWAARRQGVVTHLYYGIALYIAASFFAMLMR